MITAIASVNTSSHMIYFCCCLAEIFFLVSRFSIIAGTVPGN